MIFISFSIGEKKKNIIPCSIVPPYSPLTSCTHTKSKLCLVNSLDTIINDPDLHGLLTFHVLNLMSFSPT